MLYVPVVALLACEALQVIDVCPCPHDHLESGNDLVTGGTVTGGAKEPGKGIEEEKIKVSSMSACSKLGGGGFLLLPKEGNVFQSVVPSSPLTHSSHVRISVGIMTPNISAVAAAVVERRKEGRLREREREKRNLSHSSRSQS